VLVVDEEVWCVGDVVCVGVCDVFGDVVGVVVVVDVVVELFCVEFEFGGVVV